MFGMPGSRAAPGNEAKRRGRPTAGQVAVWINNKFIKGVQAVPTTQTLTSGTGATYTTPAGALWLEVYIVGGGGGGAGTDTVATVVAGADGTASTFNSVNANPGKGAPALFNATGALGGTAGTGTATRRMPGSPGGSGVSSATFGYVSGKGGDSNFAFGGGPSMANGTVVGIAGKANTGGGGSGASNNGGANNNNAPGGGGGETAYLIINAPAATYTYTVGPGGAGGVSTTNGGAGGSGVIFVIEHYC